MRTPRRHRRDRASFLGRVDRVWVARIAGIGFGCFLLGYVLTAVIFFPGSRREPVATVPDLRELSPDAARRALDEADLELVVGDSIPHPEVAGGLILSQSPLPSQEVAPGSAVRVLVSTGPEQRAVPVVAAMSREQAERLLTAYGFVVAVEEVPDARPAGQVVAVEPSPGTQVRIPAAVRLRVSAGPPLVAVPDLAGLGEEEARAALAASGLRLGEVQYHFEGFDVADAVHRQDPMPGDSIRQGQAVQVWIATNRLPGIPVR